MCALVNGEIRGYGSIRNWTFYCNFHIRFSVAFIMICLCTLHFTKLLSEMSMCVCVCLHFMHIIYYIFENNWTLALGTDIGEWLTITGATYLVVVIVCFVFVAIAVAVVDYKINIQHMHKYEQCIVGAILLFNSMQYFKDSIYSSSIFAEFCALYVCECECFFFIFFHCNSLAANNNLGLIDINK